MTLLELQDKLGEQVLILTNQNTPFESRKRLAEVGITVSSLAKQMINNADVVLRAEKLISEGKLLDSNIQKML